ncbi:MAG: DUF454 domain-containing protein [Firmicutes bacterium]|nr:DUF454 domain-containing protein [Bacillota bacterium]
MIYLKKIILIILGSISIALGIIGIFLPLLPTTPLLLLGASCYVKSSNSLYNWLINNKYLGSYIKNYRLGRGIPKKTKIIAISTLWLTIGYSAIFIVPLLLIKILLFFIAIGVTIHLLTIPTYKKTLK